jgi:hypothetical protein
MRPKKKTKQAFPGPVRVRHEPPTLEEAVFAAQGLSDVPEEQIEIAAGLMGVDEKEVAPILARVRAAPPIAPRTPQIMGAQGAPVVVVKRRSVARKTVGA